MPTIRLATEDDAESLLAIYSPFCSADSHVSFEFEAPSVEELRRRIAETLKRYPWLVADDSGTILGYAYAGMHSARAAYQWSVNVSVYVAEGRRGSGIGRALYTSLFAMLRLQGYVQACAGATLPNPASVGLHEAMGFEPVGVYRQVGFKAGAWHDTIWMQRPLAERPGRPAPSLSLAEARKLPGWDPAMAAGLACLQPSGDSA
jgi:L-amino acid N-acyltransferase YncA